MDCTIEFKRQKWAAYEKLHTRRSFYWQNLAVLQASAISRVSEPAGMARALMYEQKPMIENAVSNAFFASNFDILCGSQIPFLAQRYL